MGRNKLTAASDISFHQKIINKYRKARKKYSDFPMMLFMKNAVRLLNDKINLELFFRFNSNVRKMFASLRPGEKLRNFVNSHNNILMQYSTSLENPIVNTEISKSYNITNFMQDAYAINSFKKLKFDNRNFSGFSCPISDNRSFSFGNNKYYSLLNRGISQTISLRIKGKEAGNNFNFLSSHIKPIWINTTFSKPDFQQVNYNNILKSIDIRIQKNVISDHHSLFNTKPDEISIYNLFRANNTLENYFQNFKINGPSVFWRSQKMEFSNQIRVSKLYEFKYPAIYLKNNSFLNNRTLLYAEGKSFKEIKQKNVFKDQYNFFFKNNHEMEQKIEQVKKITDELKNVVTQKSIPGQKNKNDLNLNIDINRISDRVYQMIDQKIKIEKERRGYL